MHNRLHSNLFRVLLLSILLFSIGTILSACQDAASNRESVPQAVWAKQAEDVCSHIYDSRGRPPTAQSRNPDDDMALTEMWHSNLATKAVNALEAIPNAPSDGTTLIGDLRKYASQSLELANVYLEGGYQPNKIAEIESQREQAKQEVQRLSVSLGAPSCGKVVNTPE